MMGRRGFLGGGVMAMAAPQKTATKKAAAPELYEWRTIRARIPQRKAVNDYLEKELVPALGKVGAGPVGVFETMIGPEMPTFHLLIPYESAAALAAAHAKMAPAASEYLRMESALLQALEHMPRLVAPEKKARIFELRTYESPNEAAGLKKMEMFTKLGETEIFRRVGLTPVFFGRTLIGPRLPNFTYLLTYPDLASRERAWNAFGGDPEWQKLRSTPGYADTDIMTNITGIILRPTAFSQI